MLFRVINVNSGGQKRRMGRMLVPIPLFTYIRVLSTLYNPDKKRWYFLGRGTKIGPSSGRMTCPPCVWPARIRFTRLSAESIIWGEWANRILKHDIAPFMAVFRLSFPVYGSSTLINEIRWPLRLIFRHSFTNTVAPKASRFFLKVLRFKPDQWSQLPKVITIGEILLSSDT